MAELSPVEQLTLDLTATIDDSTRAPIDVIQWFGARGIRMNGDNFTPLFNRKDIAKLLGNVNYRYFKPSREIKAKSTGCTKTSRVSVMYCEVDLYRFIDYSKKDCDAKLTEAILKFMFEAKVRK